MKSVESATQEILLLPQAETRRQDVDCKQFILSRLRVDSDCEGLLMLEPMNFRWFISGALLRGTFGPDEFPAIFVNATQRWLLCSSTDTQRFFDEELDGLGFQVKEWTWSGSREQHLADLCFARKVACDRPFRECKQVGTFLDQERRRLSPFEEKQLHQLGQTLAHALEATARNIALGDTEAEVAGHLSHRLCKRGVEPAGVQITSDDRTRLYRRPGVGMARVERRCVLQATATQYGLFATASRTVAFGAIEPTIRDEYEAAARLSAFWLTNVKIGDRPSALVDAQRQLIKSPALEHEWRLASPGWWTGRAASEGTFTRNGSARFGDGNAVVMKSHIGACVVADTFILRDDGWKCITAAEDWPVRRYALQDKKFDRPDMLLRDKEES